MSTPDRATPEVPDVELLLGRLRLVIAVLLLAAAVLLEPWSRPLALTLGAGLLLASGLLHRRGGPARTGLLVDAAATAAFFLLFLGDPQAVPLAAVALLAFQLAVRAGVRGALLGAGLFAAGLAVRVTVQVTLLEGAVRPPLLLAWTTVLLVLLLVGTELRRRHDQAIELVAALDDGWRAFDLTRREQEVLALLVAGADDRSIADELFISSSTVRNHVRNLRIKVGASTREELVAIAAARRPRSAAT
jgi:DNA-binding CsgD family transcriptional regulator